jgi:hypothetical protein
MSVEIIIPFAGEDPHRLRALEYVQKKLSYPVTLAVYEREPWIKAIPIWFALHRSEADIIVIHDADVFTDGLDLAINAVEAGAAWAMPHRMVYRLSERATDVVLDKDNADDWHEYARQPYPGTPGGGIIVAPRQTLIDIPFDPRYVGWGNEDMSIDLALTVLAGKMWQGKTDLIHLWHPSQPRMTGVWGSRDHRKLYQRYVNARHDLEDMRALVAEAALALYGRIPLEHAS